MIPGRASHSLHNGIDALRQIIREREPLRPSTKLNTLQGDARTTAANLETATANTIWTWWNDMVHSGLALNTGGANGNIDHMLAVGDKVFKQGFLDFLAARP